jgi:hypothetical protein
MKKRGRKSGSGSFIQVSLAELNSVLKPNAKVIVWGRYANMLGLSGKPVEAKHEVLVASINSGKTELHIEEFSEDDISLDENEASTPSPELGCMGRVSDDESEDEVPDLVLKPQVSLEVF